MGVGLGVGVGVKVGMVVEVPGVSPSNRRFPSGVKVRIGTAIIMLIDMNSSVIAIVRRIISLLASRCDSRSRVQKRLRLAG